MRSRSTGKFWLTTDFGDGQPVHISLANRASHTANGVVLSACRYLDAIGAEIDVPLGLGSRHIAAANMSAVTKAVGIVVSESSVVRVFCHGKLVAEIIPELWMIDHAVQLRGPVQREQVGELTVLTPNQRRASTVD